MRGYEGWVVGGSLSEVVGRLGCAGGRGHGASSRRVKGLVVGESWSE